MPDRAVRKRPHVIPLRDNLPTDRFPVITLLIVAINVAVFLFLQHPSFSGEQVKTTTVVDYGAIPYRVTHPDKNCELARTRDQFGNRGETVVCEGTSEFRAARDSGAIVKVKEAPAYLTLFTSMFMHGGWLHIFFNMLFLWIFGNNVEDAMGPVRFIAFYLLGGLAATALQLVMGPNSATPNLGASGAIAAVLGGYIVMYPRARVVTLVFIIFLFTILELPAIFFLGIWFAEQLFFGALTTANTVAGGGVAYWAHVGGFVAGLLLIRIFATRRSTAADGPRFPVY